MGWEGAEALRDFMNGTVPALGDKSETMKQTKNDEIQALIHESLFMVYHLYWDF